MKRRLVRTALIYSGLLVASTGCLSATTFQTARSLPEDTYEVVVGPTGHVYGEGGAINLAGAFRYGVAPHLDLGAFLSTQPQLRVDMNYSPLELRRFALSTDLGLILGGLDFQGNTNDAVFGGNLLVRSDVGLGDAVTFTFHGGAAALSNGTEGDVLPEFGGGIRFAARRFGVHLEAKTLWNTVTESPVDSALGVGFAFGNVRRTPKQSP